MLLITSILIILVSLMHSVRGDRYLIRPILELDGLPIILGSIENTRLTLRLGWHALSLVWCGLAVMLAYLQFGGVGGFDNAVVFLWIIAAVFGLSGTVALVAFRGAHRSWIFFFPISTIAAIKAFGGFS